MNRFRNMSKKETVNYGLKPFCFRAFQKRRLLPELGCFSEGRETALGCRRGHLSAHTPTAGRVCHALPTSDSEVRLRSVGAFRCDQQKPLPCRCRAQSDPKFKGCARQGEKMQPLPGLFESAALQSWQAPTPTASKPENETFWQIQTSQKMG